MLFSTMSMRHGATPNSYSYLRLLRMTTKTYWECRSCSRSCAALSLSLSLWIATVTVSATTRWCFDAVRRCLCRSRGVHDRDSGRGRRSEVEVEARGSPDCCTPTVRLRASRLGKNNPRHRDSVSRGAASLPGCFGQRNNRTHRMRRRRFAAVSGGDDCGGGNWNHRIAVGVAAADIHLAAVDVDVDIPAVALALASAEFRHENETVRVVLPSLSIKTASNIINPRELERKCVGV
mmetsp:Transcript_19172/g.40191  ORF Transcript_19172/g.40191 Transcript_19172/m.40191 type:complete len:235 (-) Transcript_19172:564-1268(-)